ncbi:hypothetical protein LWI28_015550 [Acer negundo]|uniref:Uncharacterized protein n=1 Tax=Acer negundo TaxID=4023 RepID=A0AAD5NEY1_ACENE|nr:hypothetical protein LWI28_015550 [Acer negundo]
MKGHPARDQWVETIPPRRWSGVSRNLGKQLVKEAGSDVLREKVNHVSKSPEVNHARESSSFSIFTTGITERGFLDGPSLTKCSGLAEEGIEKVKDGKSIGPNPGKWKWWAQVRVKFSDGLDGSVQPGKRSHVHIDDGSVKKMKMVQCDEGSLVDFDEISTSRFLPACRK